MFPYSTDFRVPLPSRQPQVRRNASPRTYYAANDGRTHIGSMTVEWARFGIRFASGREKHALVVGYIMLAVFECVNNSLRRISRRSPRRRKFSAHACQRFNKSRKSHGLRSAATQYEER